MSNKTINQALKDLYTGLGGDPQALADNSTCSDYIEDLESAIKGAASGAQIDDTTASTTTVYSSEKTEELVNSIESLPSVAVGDIGEALIVESDGEGGAQWGKGNISVDISPVTFTLTSGASGILLPEGENATTVMNAVNSGKNVYFQLGNSRMPYIGNLVLDSSTRYCFMEILYGSTKEINLYYASSGLNRSVVKQKILTLS